MNEKKGNSQKTAAHNPRRHHNWQRMSLPANSNWPVKAAPKGTPRSFGSTASPRHALPKFAEGARLLDFQERSGARKRGQTANSRD